MQRLFADFRRQGARAGTSDDLAAARPSAFAGTGRTLNGATTAAAPRPPGPIVVTFYRNRYFTVNNGPGRQLDAPENLARARALLAGFALRRSHRRTAALPSTDPA